MFPAVSQIATAITMTKIIMTLSLNYDNKLQIIFLLLSLGPCF